LAKFSLNSTPFHGTVVKMNGVRVFSENAPVAMALVVIKEE
jgi:hypothetical protein